MFTKKPNMCQLFHDNNKQKKVGKIYLAKVDGEFNTETIEVNYDIICVDKKLGTYKAIKDE